MCDACVCQCTVRVRPAKCWRLDFIVRPPAFGTALGTALGTANYIINNWGTSTFSQLLNQAKMHVNFAQSCPNEGPGKTKKIVKNFAWITWQKAKTPGKGHKFFTFALSFTWIKLV